VVTSNPRPSATQPTTRPSPGESSTAEPSGIRVRGEIPLSRLPRGADARLPYVYKGVIHDGRARVRLPRADGVFRLDRVANRYVVLLYDNQPDRYRLLLVAADGSVTTIQSSAHRIDGLAVSPGRRRIAWSTITKDNPATASTLRTADVSTGRVRHKRNVNYAVHLGAWTDRGVLISPQSDASRDTRVWSPTSGRISGPLRRGFRLGEVSKVGNLMGVSYDGGHRDHYCGGVVRLDKPTDTLWTSCQYHVGSDFSPDGRTALLYPVLSDGEGVGRWVVANARTGRRAFSLDGDFETDVFWEDARHFLVSVAQGRREAIVRCSVDGYCERASRFAAVSSDVADPPAYDIGRRH
jgi:hypothetical protein